MKDRIEEIEFVLFILGSIEINLITYYFHVDNLNEKDLRFAYSLRKNYQQKYQLNQVPQTCSSQ